MGKTAFGVAAAMLVVTAGTALAGGFAIREQSTIGQGTSFAGVAAGGGGLSSLFWNPAVSAEYNQYGFISENNAALILPYAEAEVGASSSGNISEWAVVPAGNMSYAWNDEITLAITTGAPFGLTTDASNTWAGVLRGDKSSVRTLNATPSVSYKFNDMLSVGVGVQLQYMDVLLTSRAPGTGVQVFEAKGDDFGFGFTAGVLFKPTPTTDIGLGFRSSVKHKLKGDGFLLGPETDISAKFSSPEVVTLGIRQKMSEDFSLLAGVEWTNWSRFKELNVTPLATEDFSWNDSWYISAGAEYMYSPDLMLRGGVAYERSPVPDATRSVRLPDNDRFWLSLGASYKVADGWTANMAYSHIFIQDGDVNLPGLSTSFDQHLDIISVGLTRDW